MKKNLETRTIGQCKNFKFHKQNRKVASKNKVAEIKKSIMSDGIDRLPALIISRSTQTILDGQHRYQAIMELVKEKKLRLTDTVAIQWIDCETSADEYQEIIKFNGKMTPWQTRDYINAHEQTNDNYKRFRQFARESPLLNNSKKSHNKLADRAALSIIFGKTIRNQALKEGTITVTEDDIERGRQRYKEIEQVVKYLKRPKENLHGQAPKVNIEEFAKAWIQWRTIESSIPFERILLEFKARSSKYSKMPMTSKKYFLDILNQVKVDIFTLNNPLQKKKDTSAKR